MATDVRPTQVTTAADRSFFPACFEPGYVPDGGVTPDQYTEAARTIYDAMREENPAIPSDENIDRARDRCRRQFLVGKYLLEQQFEEASIVGRIWQGLFGGGFGRLDKEFEHCMATEQSWQGGWARYARAMALYAVARIDMKDVGDISQDEFDTAEAYAVSWMRYFGKRKQMEMDRARSESLSTGGEASAIEDKLSKMVHELEEKAWDVVHENQCR